MWLTICCWFAAVQAIRAELDSTAKDLAEARANLDSAGQAQQQLQSDFAAAAKLRDESSSGACKGMCMVTPSAGNSAPLA